MSEVREIKFRGKREDNGEWVYGSFIPDALEGGNSDLVSWGFIRRYNRDIGKMETIEVDRETIGQFTGLHDKNGVEIYEGDIVQFHLGGRVHIVVYDPAIFRLADINGDFTTSGYPDWNMCEVTGNIHDQED